MRNYVNAEKSFKKFFKRKIKISIGVVITFLITGTTGYTKYIPINDEINQDCTWNYYYENNAEINPSGSVGGRLLYSGDTLKINNNATLIFDYTNKDMSPLLYGGGGQYALYLQKEPYEFGDTTKELKIQGGNLKLVANKEDSSFKYSTALYIGKNIDKGKIILDNTNLHIKDYQYGIKSKGGEVLINNAKTEFEDVIWGIYTSKGGETTGNVKIETDELIVGNNYCLAYAADNSSIILNADKTDITIDSNGGYLAYAKGEGKVDIISRSGKIIGNVSTLEGENGKISLDLSNTIWEGASLYEKDINKDITINLKNNANWKVTENSAVKDLILDDNAKLSFNRKQDDFIKIYVTNEMKGNNATINMNIDASRNENNSDHIYINGSHKGTHYITLNNIAANNFTDGAEGTILVSVKDEIGEFKANDTEGTLYWNKYELGRYDESIGDTVTNGYETDWYLKKVEKIDPEDRPTTDVETVVAANSMNYYTWRETDKLLQRMGELRYNGESEEGVWFRLKSNKLSRDDNFNFENRYTTYQIGYDKETEQTPDFKRFQGIAFDYTDGKGSYEYGSGENNHVSISLYNTDSYRDGKYIDTIFKITGMDTDYKVYNSTGNKITGDFRNLGVSLSTEYGKKYENENKWYIEPQIQLKLGYLFGDNYKTNNNVRVEQDDIISAIGRTGIHFGKETSETSKIYIKGNILHEFVGDYKIDMYSNEDKLTIDNDFDDTWFEVGIGTARNITEDFHVYADVERQIGSNIDSSWQFNIGFRYRFGGIKDFSFAAASLFDFDKSEVKPEGKELIKSVSQIMNKRNLKGTLIIEGHTDWKGSEEYNQKLSERRAVAVEKEFRQNILNKNINYETKGYGEMKPIADNLTEEGRAKNRRVDMKFQKK